MLDMEVPELSLAPTRQFVKCDEMNSSSSKHLVEISSQCSRKRKLLLHDHHHIIKSQTSVDLQLKDPLPLHWEQCLDLQLVQSGKMYYLNRKTSRKSWNWPKDQDHHHHQKLDLELELNNINSSSSKSDSLMNFGHGHGNYSSSESSNMVALPCLNCHLLVILSKSSPSCPNCKHFHTLFPNCPSSSNSPPNTLPLLN
ncbi:protein CURLY FLAG LEAF 1-like isoform X1 [Cucumis melo]|uniref:Protein CURLY FLAG LEAF 1-like isoform X1 n=1 Tax=Cucumis melo TaxID=3656 RepID=A0ABM3KL71_CUCME|nr:protein CURLY FLAG LEAF 1-like isoform X1 [Cucumis melo]